MPVLLGCAAWPLVTIKLRA